MNAHDLNHYHIEDTCSCITQKILTITRSFNFPLAFFPVFLCINLNGPEHFETEWFSQKQMHKMFDKLDFTTPQNTVFSITRWEDSAVKTALLNACSMEICSDLEALLSEDNIQTNIITQMQYMQLLYFRDNFRNHMLELYRIFIEPRIKGCAINNTGY